MTNLKFTSISLVTLLFSLFLVQKTTAQSPWTKKKGEAYVQLTFSTIPNYSDIFSDNTYITSREITDNTIQLYGEYGISDDLTLLVNIPLKSIRTGGAIENSTLPLSIDKTSKTSFGNIQIGVKHKICEGKFIFSGQLSIEANTSSFDASSGISTGYDAWTFTPTISLGKGYSNYYFQAFTGVDFRTNSYSSNFKLGGEFGLTSIKKTTLIAYLDIVKSFKDGNVILPTSSIETALYINNQEYSAFGLKGLYEFTNNYGISLGVGGAVSATNVAKQLALSVGFFYKL